MNSDTVQARERLYRHSTIKHMTEIRTEQLATLRDESVPGVIVEIVDQNAFMRSALVRCVGLNTRVNLAYTPEAIVGDHLIVHAGFAISVISADEAGRIQKDLQRLKAQQKEQIARARAEGSGLAEINAALDDDDDDPEYSCLCC